MNKRTARTRFKKGDRVKLNAEGLRSGLMKPSHRGTVVGFSHLDYLVRINWDHHSEKNIHSYHVDLLEKD